MKSSAKRKIADKGLKKGCALHSSGKYEDATGCYDKVIEIDPEHANAWCSKVLALHVLKNAKPL